MIMMMMIMVMMTIIIIIIIIIIINFETYREGMRLFLFVHELAC